MQRRNLTVNLSGSIELLGSVKCALEAARGCEQIERAFSEDAAVSYRSHSGPPTARYQRSPYRLLLICAMLL